MALVGADRPSDGASERAVVPVREVAHCHEPEVELRVDADRVEEPRAAAEVLSVPILTVFVGALVKPSEGHVELASACRRLLHCCDAFR